MARIPEHPHLARLRASLDAFDATAERLDAWGRYIAAHLVDGGRLLAAGNGGSAAEAQHLTAELVGRYEHDRAPLSAIALHADSSSVTAIANDYGAEEVFARQVRAHGRPGDVLVLLSTSGTSPNILAAAEAGSAAGMRVWGLTGAAPNPLALACDDAVSVESDVTCTVQEVHLVAVHLLASAVEAGLAELEFERAVPDSPSLARSQGRP